MLRSARYFMKIEAKGGDEAAFWATPATEDSIWKKAWNWPGGRRNGIRYVVKLFWCLLWKPLVLASLGIFSAPILALAIMALYIHYAR